MANNQYKFFRQVSDNPIIGPPTFENFLAGSVNNEKLEKRYDEPTYLTFKVLSLVSLRVTYREIQFCK